MTYNTNLVCHWSGLKLIKCDKLKYKGPHKIRLAKQFLPTAIMSVRGPLTDYFHDHLNNPIVKSTSLNCSKLLIQPETDEYSACGRQPWLISATFSANRQSPLPLIKPDDEKILAPALGHDSPGLDCRLS